MRPVSPKESKGLEELRLNLEPQSFGLEEPERWDEATSQRYAQEILRLLGGTYENERGANPVARVPASRIAYSDNSGGAIVEFPIEVWSTGRRAGAFELPLVRIRYLLMLDREQRDRLMTINGGPELLAQIEKNVIVVDSLKISNFANYPLAAHCQAAALNMMRVLEQDKPDGWWDDGSGMGELLLVAARYGVKYLLGVENVRGLGLRAEDNLTLNGCVGSRAGAAASANAQKFLTVTQDLADLSAIEADAAGFFPRGSRVGKSSNIGAWPKIGQFGYTVSNVETIQAIPPLEAALGIRFSCYVAAGYMYSPPALAPPGTFQLPATILADQSVLDVLIPTMQISKGLSFFQSYAPVEYALSWYAEMRPRLLAAPTQPTAAGNEELTLVPIGDFADSINTHLRSMGTQTWNTQHYGQARVLLRVVENRQGLYCAVGALAEFAWVQQHKDLEDNITPNALLDYGYLGPCMVEVYLNRYQTPDQNDRVVIERVQILRGPLRIEYPDELECRAMVLRAVGEWGRSNNVPVFLISPEALREARPGLKEKTIDYNYYRNVDRSVWVPDTLTLKDSPLTLDKRYRFFRYDVSGTPQSRPTAAGNEEVMDPAVRDAAAGLESYLAPAAIGFDAAGPDTEQLQRDNVYALLEHMRSVDTGLDPANALVVNVGSGVRPLLVRSPWQKVTNWDQDQSYAPQAAQAAGASFSPVDVRVLALAQKSNPAPPESLPRVMLCYRMAPFIQIYNRPEEFFEALWTLIPPGGWIVAINPPNPQFQISSIQQFRDGLVSAVPAAASADMRVVSTDGTMKGALAIAIRKSDGLEEPTEVNVRRRANILLRTEAGNQLQALTLLGRWISAGIPPAVANQEEELVRGLIACMRTNNNPTVQFAAHQVFADLVRRRPVPGMLAAIDLLGQNIANTAPDIAYIAQVGIGRLLFFIPEARPRLESLSIVQQTALNAANADLRLQFSAQETLSIFAAFREFHPLLLTSTAVRNSFINAVTIAVHEQPRDMAFDFFQGMLSNPENHGELAGLVGDISDNLQVRAFPDFYASNVALLQLLVRYGVGQSTYPQLIRRLIQFIRGDEWPDDLKQPARTVLGQLADFPEVREEMQSEGVRPAELGLPSGMTWPALSRVLEAIAVLRQFGYDELGTNARERLKAQLVRDARQGEFAPLDTLAKTIFSTDQGSGQEGELMAVMQAADRDRAQEIRRGIQRATGGEDGLFGLEEGRRPSARRTAHAEVLSRLLKSPYNFSLVEADFGSRWIMDTFGGSAFAERRPDRIHGMPATVLHVRQGTAVRAPLDPAKPTGFFSPPHIFCQVCLAIGTNPVTGLKELVQWHVTPDWIGAGEIQEPNVVRNGLPPLLSGLRDVRIVLSPMLMKGVDQPEQLLQEWDATLRQAAGVQEPVILSVTVIPRNVSPFTTAAETYADADGFSLHIGWNRGKFALKAEKYDSSPDLRSWSWDELRTGVLPVLTWSTPPTEAQRSIVGLEELKLGTEAGLRLGPVRRAHAEFFSGDYVERLYTAPIVTAGFGSAWVQEVADLKRFLVPVPEGPLTYGPRAAGRRIVTVPPSGQAVRVPVDPDDPVAVSSAGHAYCNVVAARGFNPETGRWEIVEWHYTPAWIVEDYDEYPASPSNLVEEMPRLLAGLRDIRVFLSPVSLYNYPSAEGLQLQWNDALRTAGVEQPVRSVTVVPRAEQPMMAVADSYTDSEGVGLLVAYNRAGWTPDRLEQDPDLRSWSWDELTTGTFDPIQRKIHPEEKIGQAADLREFAGITELRAGFRLAPDQEELLQLLASGGNLRAISLDPGSSNLPLYAQSNQLHAALLEANLPNPPGSTRLVPIALPEEDARLAYYSWDQLGLILEDASLGRPIPRDRNPNNLPKYPGGLQPTVEAARQLDPLRLLALIFCRRMGIPESMLVGQMFLTDLEGRGRLILLFA